MWIIDKSASDRRNELAEEYDYFERKIQHISLQKRCNINVCVDYNLYFTNKEKENLNLNKNVNYNKKFSIYLDRETLKLRLLYTVTDSLLLPENFYIRIKDSLKNEVDCIDRYNFFKRAHYSNNENTWIIEIK